MTDRWERVEELFGLALALEPGARPEFLVRACGSDPEIRHEVEELLRADTASRDDAFLRAPIAEAVETISNGARSSPVGQVGDVRRLLGDLGLIHLASARMAEHRYLEAEILLRRALELLREGLPTCRREIGEVESDLGACLTHLGQYRAAESLLVTAHRNLQTSRGSAERTRQTLRRLVALYDAWEKPEQARDRLEQAADTLAAFRPAERPGK
jgi:tetratricopeptide (TPR) repeat protein